ncbi:MAG: hypothetical protein HRT87_10240 [Legionellales bacterium]|nr:hypothetical protein [Legionellales bacterium]
MSIARRIPLQNMSLFGDLVHGAWSMIKSTCKFQRLDIVFDSYIEQSTKEGERMSRYLGEPLGETTKIPVQVDRFWASPKNKEMFQSLCHSYLSKKAEQEKVNIVLSGYVRSTNDLVSCLDYLPDGGYMEKLDLNSYIEEADMRIVPHINEAIKCKFTRIVLISNDSDVVCLINYYMSRFQQNGLTEMWIMYGTGTNTRFLPMHTMYVKIGSTMSSVVIKAHILTGSDGTSKVGTKAAALKAKPDEYLMEFGEAEEMTYDSFRKAEIYLVKVLHSSSSCETFDELRFDMYVNKKTSLADLPPTSSSIQGHLQRCYFVIRQCLSLLDGNFEKEPNDYGWELNDGVMLPCKCLLPMPEHFTARCTCKNKKCTGRCKCKGNVTACTEFCQCRSSCNTGN